MTEANREDFNELIERYLSGTATTQERKVLEKYYSLFDHAPDLSDKLPEHELSALRNRLKKRIEVRLDSRAKPLFYRSLVFRVAAAAVIFTGLGWMIMTIRSAKSPEPSSITSAEVTDFNRFLTLPDSSRVVLHNGSKLELADDFNSGSRRVYLTGEAYFDVASMPESPFVIHTGKVRTTVLGTAFNIKAWPEQKDITVSVNRGKVRVEDDHKLLAILTPDKQITYHTDLSTIDEKDVKAENAITWIQKDMDFDEMPLGELALHLSRRYSVEIRFENRDLELCPITGRFSGTETLGEVMRTLALTSNTRFSVVENEVLIQGDKCF